MHVHHPNVCQYDNIHGERTERPARVPILLFSVYSKIYKYIIVYFVFVYIRYAVEKLNA